ncbi:Asp/Glu/hydantoin racemase [Albimonas donghaensis]|uniref:Asp/Glu/hydantoin racemase n=1 Tax=Albimonas donghaensis TaxID=356660 RepID=A0A1H3AHH3_9RHOB|nr:aspartate/glutamate racemase family protein [Albimonas donghaensis]SDX29073.1 Asp/Glu/hydantoin racemase [Albimonas donghaensis]
MKILLVNPNMTQAMTDRLAAVARRVAAPGTEIVPLTATHGFPYISSRSEAQIAGAVALEMIAGNLEGADAVVIAAFGDPGLKAARELFDLPVTGMAEAAMMAALPLGERFSIVTFTPLMSSWFLDSVEALGLAPRFAGLRTPPAAEGPVADVAATMRETLVDLALAAAREDRADVVIFGGAPLAGMAFEMGPDFPCVAVDPIAAAVMQAEMLVRLAPGGACKGGLARPPGKASVGLAAPLARHMGGG